MKKIDPMYQRLPRLKVEKFSNKKKAVSSVNSLKTDKRHLWKAAIKWPLYSVAIMPVVIATAWRIGNKELISVKQLVGFIFASILILFWENLTNDLFDDETGVDQFKLHSIVKLLGSKAPVRILAYISLSIGLILIFIISLVSSLKVLFLVLITCILGFLYQGPPFRLGYKGLGEPLCWLAFGPFATAASLLAISPEVNNLTSIPWRTALELSSGPALATTLVLFCSHFHQIAQDAKHGKKSPLVRIGTYKGAQLIPWAIASVFFLEFIPIVQGIWPITALGSLLGLPAGIHLTNLLNKHHNHPDLIIESKFLALRFQTLNGIGLSLGLALASI